jgi:hypothetical protein
MLGVMLRVEASSRSGALGGIERLTHAESSDRAVFASARRWCCGSSTPEGSVNQYIVNKTESTPHKLVFDSERFENYDSAARARETYEFMSANEFVETFATWASRWRCTARRISSA